MERCDAVISQRFVESLRDFEALLRHSSNQCFMTSCRGVVSFKRDFAPYSNGRLASH